MRLQHERRMTQPAQTAASQQQRGRSEGTARGIGRLRRPSSGCSRDAKDHRSGGAEERRGEQRRAKCISTGIVEEWHVGPTSRAADANLRGRGELAAGWLCARVGVSVGVAFRCDWSSAVRFCPCVVRMVISSSLSVCRFLFARLVADGSCGAADVGEGNDGELSRARQTPQANNKQRARAARRQRAQLRCRRTDRPAHTSMYVRGWQRTCVWLSDRGWVWAWGGRPSQSRWVAPSAQRPSPQRHSLTHSHTHARTSRTHTHTRTHLPPSVQRLLCDHAGGNHEERASAPAVRLCRCLGLGLCPCRSPPSH